MKMSNNLSKFISSKFPVLRYLTLKVEILNICSNPVLLFKGGRSRGSWSVLDFKTLHRNSIFVTSSVDFGIVLDLFYTRSAPVSNMCVFY